MYYSASSYNTYTYLNGNEEALLPLFRVNNAFPHNFVFARKSDALWRSWRTELEDVLHTRVSSRCVDGVTNGKEDGRPQEQRWLADYLLE
jgi:hypothetical protein